MDDFPEFMKRPENAVSSSSQSKGVEGWVYDGVDGSQMACWICRKDLVSSEHTHGFDEYFVVIQGEYVLMIGNEDIPFRTGEEYQVMITVNNIR